MELDSDYETIEYRDFNSSGNLLLFGLGEATGAVLFWWLFFYALSVSRTESVPHAIFRISLTLAIVLTFIALSSLGRALYGETITCNEIDD